jgi:hypothetical protein
MFTLVTPGDVMLFRVPSRATRVVHRRSSLSIADERRRSSLRPLMKFASSEAHTRTQNGLLGRCGLKQVNRISHLHDWHTSCHCLLIDCLILPYAVGSNMEKNNAVTVTARYLAVAVAAASIILAVAWFNASAEEPAANISNADICRSDRPLNDRDGLASF